MHQPLQEDISRGVIGTFVGEPGVARCQEMATLPAGYIPQHKVSSASSSGSLGFIVCEQCCRMVDSVPIRHIYAVTNSQTIC